MKIRHEISPEQLEAFAWEYISECINNKKEQPTASGKIALVSERHLPTIAYFLKIWLPMKGKPTLCRSTYYNWLRSENPEIMDTIKNIEGMFNALALDIVANEGKGIFYAKNKLGMSDKEVERKEIEPITGMVIIDSKEENSMEITNRPIIYINGKDNN
jgi:hypothetical protein